MHAPKKFSANVIHKKKMSLYFDIHSHQKTKLETHFARCNNVSQIDFVNYENLHKQSNQFYSAGLHPWYITESNWESDIEKLADLLKNENVVALGECGLDALRGVDMKLQEKIFISQIHLAEKFNLPVVVHCVRAYNELIKIVKAEKIKTPIIIHGFQSKLSILKPLVQGGFYISIGAAVLNNLKINWNEILDHIPNDSLFLETDDSDVTIDLIYERVAELKNISVEMLKNQISENVSQVFNIKS